MNEAMFSSWMSPTLAYNLTIGGISSGQNVALRIILMVGYLGYLMLVNCSVISQCQWVSSWNFADPHISIHVERGPLHAGSIICTTQDHVSTSYLMEGTRGLTPP